MLPKVVETVQDRVLAPSKQFFADYQPLGHKSEDKAQLIDQQQDGDARNYVSATHRAPTETGAVSALKYRLLTTADRCICCRCSKRWQLALLANLGLVIVFGIRCNFGAARDRMNYNFTDAYGVEHEPVTNWDESILGAMESSFFYGYLITQVPGGFIAARIPANKLLGIAIALTSFFNLLMPVACRAGYGLAVIIQIIQGLSQGVAFPSLHGIWRHWAPPLERTKLTTTTYTGSYAGAVIGLPLSALMTSYISWQSSYYFYGVMGCLWFVVWWTLIFEKPGEHPMISDQERTYIESAIGPTSHNIPQISTVPWKAIFTSKCVWAIIVANFCRSWTFYLLLIHQLTYMREVLNIKMENTGFWASLPHAVMAVVVLIGGQLADCLRSRRILSTTAVRKIFNCGGFGMEAVFLIVCAYTKNPAGAITALVFAVGFSGFAISGFNVNHLDIAPRYASILMGISNGIGTISGMIGPVVTEKLTKRYGVKGWETVFLLAGLIHLTGVTFYAFFASGEQQSWAEPPAEEETWKPDDFASKAAMAGMASNYGTTEPIRIQPLPTKDEIVNRRHTTIDGKSWNADEYSNANARRTDDWDASYQTTDTRTGAANQNFYGY